MLCFSISSRVNCFCGDGASCLMFSMRFSVEGCNQPPVPVPGSHGCRKNRVEHLFSWSSWISGRTLYQQLFIMLNAVRIFPRKMGDISLPHQVP